MKVSALIITYNQERYIAQAIESALMQETDFDYEVVISEDCSPDGTRAIVQDYEARHPGRIRVDYSPRNLGGVENFVLSFRGCRGEYVALLEGDDYWTSPRKLQAQADFLDGHPECSMCVHGVTEVFENGRRPVEWIAPDQKEISTLGDLLLNNFVHTSSAMLRHDAFEDYPRWVYDAPFSDYPTWVQAATHGDIGYLKEFLGAYRVHDAGYWSGVDPVDQVRSMIDFYERMRPALGDAYDEVFDRVLARFHAQLACELAQVPPRAVVLVAGGGDDELLKLYRPARQFDPAGDSIEEARAEGAEFIVVPQAERHAELCEELDARHPRLSESGDAVLWGLRDDA